MQQVHTKNSSLGSFSGPGTLGTCLFDNTHQDGLAGLTHRLKRTLTILVSELGGPNKEDALSGVWDHIDLFQHASDTLGRFLDNQSASGDLRLEYLSEQFENRLALVVRLLKQGSNLESVTFLDRIQLKDALHHLLENVQRIGNLSPPQKVKRQPSFY